jgi:ElaB/YqjD/DUF883 family membrane-anchored ribosome-binding protein
MSDKDAAPEPGHDTAPEENHASQGETSLNDAMAKAQESLGSTFEQARELGDQLTETARERPLAALLVVGAVGFALGYLLRG